MSAMFVLIQFAYGIYGKDLTNWGIILSKTLLIKLYMLSKYTHTIIVLFVHKL